MENWLGQIQIKIDEKGRFLLPSQSAQIFPEKNLVLSLGVYDKKTYLELITLDEWEEKLNQLQKLPQNNPKTKAYKRFLLSGSAKVNLDKQNRLTIPAFQRERILVHKEAVIVNLDNKLELWSTELWNSVSDKFIENIEDIEEWVDSFENEQKKEAISDIKSVA